MNNSANCLDDVAAIVRRQILCFDLALFDNTVLRNCYFSSLNWRTP